MEIERLSFSEETKSFLKATDLDWFRQQLIDWADYNLRDFPWRRTTDPHAIFVAEFLLQKTDAAKIVPIYETFQARHPTIEALSLVSMTEVADLLKPLEFHFRAERLCESVQKINAFYHCKIPDVEAQLLVLPGVGKYTAWSANIAEDSSATAAISICTHAFGQQQPILNTNVARLVS